MAKKKINKIIFWIYIGLGLGLILTLVLLNIKSFVNTSIRFSDIWKAQPLRTFFEVYNDNSEVIYTESLNEIESFVNGVGEDIIELKERGMKDIILTFLSNFFDFMFNLFIYFCNYGLNLVLIFYIFLHETFAGTQMNIKTSPLALTYIKVDIALTKAKDLTKSALKKALNWMSYNRRLLTLSALALLFACGFLYRVLVEVIIFIICYFIKMINLETYLVVFSVFKFLFLLIYPYLKYIPLWIWIPLLALLVFLRALNRANFKLQKNHERLREFVRDDLTQTCFINGCPGTGKTLLNMSLSLACEENFIDELETILLDYESKYKDINFALVRQHPEEYPEHVEYTEAYRLLNDRKSFIISNYAIYSPMFNEYSKIFNFDYMRVNKRCDIYPLEEYIVISLSEFDKEYNSHDDKKIVGEDGAATFFSTVSHDLKRHAKIFVDYQLRQQVPLRIRGNSEYFINIKDRKKNYPLLMFVYYLPFLGLFKLAKHFLKKYELKKSRVERKSSRYGKGEYKRNDLTLPYVILRGLASTLQKICNWFDQFYYYKLITNISQEDENDTATKGVKKSLCINIRDLSYKNQRLYDSTFLSFSYEEKKNLEFKDLDTFTKLSPPKEELDKCHSRFYDKINN